MPGFFVAVLYSSSGHWIACCWRAGMYPFWCSEGQVALNSHFPSLRCGTSPLASETVSIPFLQIGGCESGLGPLTALATRMVFPPSGHTKWSSCCCLPGRFGHSRLIGIIFAFITGPRHLLLSYEFLDPWVKCGWAFHILWLGLWLVRVIIPCHLIHPGQWARVVGPNAQAVLKCYLPPWMWQAWRLGSPADMFPMVWRCWGFSAMPICSLGFSLSMAAQLHTVPQSLMTMADGTTQLFNFILKESCGHQCPPMGIPCHS